MSNRLPPMLVRFAWAMMAMAVLSLLYTVVMTRLLHTPHPYGVTLFWGQFKWSDFTVFAERSHHFGSASYWDELNYPFTYPAPLGVVFALLYKLPHPLALYLALCVAGLALWAWWLAAKLAQSGVSHGSAVAFALIVLATAWPVAGLLNTANIEGIVAILLAFGVFAVLRERWWLGATLIGLAAPMKLFPFILLALLLSRRRWREFAWGLAVAACATIASLAWLGPNVFAAQRHVDAGLRFIRMAFILSTQRDALNYSHSLFSPLKFAVMLTGRHIAHLAPHSAAETALLSTTLQIYMVAAAIFGLALYFARIRKLPMLNQVLALTICAVLLPPLSADYTLLELLLPFGLLCHYAVDAARNHQQPRGLGTCFVCFALIFSWETFLTIRYSFDRPVRAAALTVLLVIVLRHPFEWPMLITQREAA